VFGRAARANVLPGLLGPSGNLGSWIAIAVQSGVAAALLAAPVPPNALKFGAGKPVEVFVFGAQGNATLVVRDHGIGIDPAEQARIFDRFERAVSTRHYGGLGLGLYVSRRIVEAHGGTIRVASRPGDGATFTVELPRSLAGVAAAATGVAQPEARHA